MHSGAGVDSAVLPAMLSPSVVPVGVELEAATAACELNSAAKAKLSDRCVILLTCLSVCASQKAVEMREIWVVTESCTTL